MTTSAGNDVSPDPLLLSELKQELLFSLMSETDPVKAVETLLADVSALLGGARLAFERLDEGAQGALAVRCPEATQAARQLVFHSAPGRAPILEPWMTDLDRFIERSLLHGEVARFSVPAPTVSASMIAQDLHDSVAQELAYLSMRASLLVRRVDQPARASPIAEELQTGLARLQRHVRELISQARVTMDGKTLRTSLAELVCELSRRCDMVFNLDNRLPDGLLGAEIELQVLHIVRESLINAIRHSRARTVNIQLRADGSSYLLVSVMDDGIGLPGRSQGEGHYGLVIIKERAMGIGAECEIATRPEGGTRVRLVLPLTDAQRGPEQ